MAASGEVTATAASSDSEESEETFKSSAKSTGGAFSPSSLMMTNCAYVYIRCDLYTAGAGSLPAAAVMNCALCGSDYTGLNSHGDGISMVFI